MSEIITSFFSIKPKEMRKTKRMKRISMGRKGWIKDLSIYSYANSMNLKL